MAVNHRAHRAPARAARDGSAVRICRTPRDPAPGAAALGLPAGRRRCAGSGEDGARTAVLPHESAEQPAPGRVSQLAREALRERRQACRGATRRRGLADRIGKPPGAGLLCGDRRSAGGYRSERAHYAEATRGTDPARQDRRLSGFRTRSHRRGAGSAGGGPVCGFQPGPLGALGQPGIHGKPLPAGSA